jgi:hypothetical protein
MTELFALLDGPLSAPGGNRDNVITRMAAELVRDKTYHDERAAMRTLSGRGFALGDIAMLVDAARASAKEIAAVEAKVAIAMQDTRAATGEA